eukprot:762559-Hanusia_phi.AAC.4
MSYDMMLNEFVSVLIASNELCPLPLITLHEESKENRFASSFDLLFEMVRQHLQSARVWSTEQKEAMKQRKLGIMQTMRDRLLAVDTGCDKKEPPTAWTAKSREEVYSIFCDTFRQLAAVYAQRDDLDLRFVGMEQVDRTHPVNLAAATHFRALSFLNAGDSKPESPLLVLDMDVQGMSRMHYWFNVCLHAHRIRVQA